MTLALVRRDEAVSSLAASRPDVPAAALRLLGEVTEELPGVWPCEPDTERVRFYEWASGHVRRAQEMVREAWERLDSVAQWMSYLAEELDAFAATGQVPHLEDADLEPGHATRGRGYAERDPGEHPVAALQASKAPPRKRPGASPAGVVGRAYQVLVTDGGWMGVDEMAAVLGNPTTTAAAALRDLVAAGKAETRGTGGRGRPRKEWRAR